MRGPEEWPSRGSKPEDRIRLTGPAATNLSKRVLRLRSGFRLRAPASLTPADRLNLQVRLPQIFRSRSFGCAQDFACGLPLRSRPQIGSTYRSGCHKKVLP